MNYFELFNLEVNFNVDLSALASTYQKLQQLTHPDKFATASDRDRLLSVQKNAQVNDGYQTLKSPLSRAEYMLNLRGIDLQHEQTTLQDNVFLMQQMEWREQLEDIEHDAQPEQKLAELDDEIKGIIADELKTLKEQLLVGSEQANQGAAIIIRKLKFMYKLRQEIERKDEQLNDF
ncbi:MAG: co-chaperone HscB [Paraglaciecola sp.]|uniref:co-chaperone HscB n=1 Tax=Paraglaciecola sp. TaxID=1920173 RepID=UPI00273E5029|nr:co-chaperone HscB [Paraglaciecola sp.]MDP5029503.1 co-chaperone HscB [Paraglaciecola sp.]MDP5129284.1 co-chaperone HscB [Paraglaciecola sp.]